MNFVERIFWKLGILTFYIVILIFDFYILVYKKYAQQNRNIGQTVFKK
ncbi:MAG: hypothetical protein US88_C0025G0004 [Parcubacteria group bacterium GW2011_GWA2_38_27]|nr:MAG: hypothetical protein US88_C0025G0004 [Parcubacteria group bacterium GW2011_GWA2_38_27]